MLHVFHLTCETSACAMAAWLATTPISSLSVRRGNPLDVSGPLIQPRHIATETERSAAPRMTREYNGGVHPGTEADPSLVPMSPFASVARGVAVASLVTRAVTRA